MALGICSYIIDSGPHAKNEENRTGSLGDRQKIDPFCQIYITIHYWGALIGPYPQRAFLEGVHPRTTQGHLRPGGKCGDIVVERVARATLTNVDTFIDAVIDAPGLRPARDCRYEDDSHSE